MNYNFLLVIFLFLIFVFVLKKRYFLVSPDVLFIGGFLFSSIMLLINTNIWNYTISFKTVIVIVSGMIVFELGAITANIYKRADVKTNPCLRVLQVKHSKTADIIMFVLALFALIIRLLDMYFTTGSFYFFESVAIYKSHSGGGVLATIIKLLNPLVIMVGIISLVLFIQSLLIEKKVRLKYIFLSLSYFLYFALTGTRIEIIYFFFYLLIAIFLLFPRIKNKTFKPIILSVVFIGLLIVSFLWLGMFTGKTQSQASAWDNISMYSASSIAALDNQLLSFEYSTSNLGTFSLRGVANFFSLFGIDLSFVAERNRDFVLLGEMQHQTNIYTCFYSIIFEFGYVGMVLILFVEGFVFQLLFKKMLTSQGTKQAKWLIIYLYVMGYLSLSFVAERIFGSLLSVTSVVFFVALSLFMDSFFYNKTTKKKL